MSDRLPDLTVQREALLEALWAQLIGTLDIDTSTNCLVVRADVVPCTGQEHVLVASGLSRL